MELKVYISLPCGERNTTRILEIRDKVESLVDKTRINVHVLNSGPSNFERFEGLSKDVDKLFDADFVIFSPDWKSDYRCRAEMELVTANNILWINANVLESAVKNFAANAFKLDIPEPKPPYISVGGQ